MSLTPNESSDPAAQRLPEDLVFVAFNSRVIALDRYSGVEVWVWKAPRSGSPVLLLDGDRLIASVNGYTYCLDPLNGALVWNNDLLGMGVGIPSLASTRGGSSAIFAHLSAQESQKAAAAAS